MLEWNVYVGNFNSRKIETYNIFRHGGFIDRLRKSYRKHKEDFHAFEAEVRSELMYYFWSKCEWEIVINRWPPRSDEEAVKIDVYDQVRMNWERFIEYLWENRKELEEC